MRRTHTPALRATAAAVLLLATATGARAADPAPSQYDVAAAAAKKAVDQLGIQLWGYMRAGAYYAKNDLVKGHYGLGDLGYNRLGNEGDQYFEFGIGKKWEVNGAKLGVYYMPYAYRNSDHKEWENSGTKQIYADISGLDFAPELSFWAGQRFHRIQDIHIIDQWLVEDGDNWGAGVDGIKMGGMGTLNVAIHTEGNADDSSSPSNARRINLQWRKIPINPDGTLDLTAGWVHGDFADKKNGYALGAVHNQKIGSLTNTVFLQASNGHANLSGKFYGLNGREKTGSPFICAVAPNADGSCPVGSIVENPNRPTVTTYSSGAKQFRIVDSVNWQSGPLGGQALIGYQTGKPDDTDKTTKNFAIGGRVSYGVSRHVKLYGDLNFATLKTDGSDTQRLNKQTIAVALAPNTDFWSRPEIRLYLTRVGGNDAYKATGAFGSKSSAILAGVQVEAWWE